MDDLSTTLRKIPKIDVLLDQVRSVSELAGIPRPLVAEAIRAVVARFRQSIAEDSSPPEVEAYFGGRPFLDALICRTQALLGRRHVAAINATGILLHTGLGRAPLSDASIDAAAEAARYAIVEIDPETGERDRREIRVAELLCDLTGAEAATVVNNNAAAVLITLNELAAGGEVLVARGEMVEIGGGFRMPDVMEASGCRLREVGTTNRTYVRDYAGAIGDHTALILRVHTSNFRVIGFTCSATEHELVELAREHGLPYVHDLGSGLLRPVDLDPLREEPTVVEAVHAGADVVTFSGDKLLGGPQAGVLVGRSSRIEAIRSNPLFRAMRPDKLTLASLEATLLAYRRAPEGLPDLPLYQALARERKELASWAAHLATGFGKLEGVDARVRDTVGFLGSGSAPVREIPGVAVALRSARAGADELAERLRRGDPRVYARIEDGAVLLEMRSVFPDELELLFDAVAAAASAYPGECSG